MKQLNKNLMWKLCLYYYIVMTFGVSILTLSNLYVLGLKFENLLKYNIGAILLEGFLGTSIFLVITIIFLKNTRRLIKEPFKSEGLYIKAWNEMVLFPYRILWGMIIFGIAASFFYHVGEIRFYGDKLNEIYLELLCVILFEQTLSLILALLLFTGIKRILRPYILQIPGELIKNFHKSTFFNNMLAIFSCLLIIIIYSILWFVIDGNLKSRPLNISGLIYIALFDLCFGVVIFSFFISEIRDDFTNLIDAMSSLLKGSRAQLKTKVPIVSNTEIGALGLIFNELQQKVSNEYDDIDTELQLASSIQQRLLPEGYKNFGPFTAAGICKPCRDVGGDFFDILPLNENKFAVIIGDVVGKGMPAALIMSAVLVLLRNEIHRGGTPSEILMRLNKIIIELGISDICLTLGIGVFDNQSEVLQYASAGHVSPYIKNKSGLQQLQCSSLPLGIYIDEQYTQIEYDMTENDRFIFYTDGIIDAFEGSKLSSFDIFENILLTSKYNMPIQNQIDLLISKIEKNNKTKHEDDKTLVIVDYSPVILPEASTLKQEENMCFEST